jgi:hypothetical protein
MRARSWSRLSLFLTALASVVTLGLPACGGGGGGGGSSLGDGTVQMAVTDAPSDQLDLFEVDVNSVTLHRLDGAVTEVLPAVQRVDLADLVALSELLTAATVREGAYDRVALTLDFRTAAVHVVGAATNATVLDRDGNSFTGTTRIEVEFPGDRPLVVTPRVMRFVELDFDLDASTVVDATANTVKVGSVLYAKAEPGDPKPVRSFGALLRTDEANSTITYEVLRRRDAGHGPEHTVFTKDDTHFEVDGATADGAAGFALLAAKSIGTRLEIHGIFDPVTRRLVARAVAAGRGVFDGTRDLLDAIVVARTGGAGADATLTIRGTVVDTGHTATFHRPLTLNTSFANTRVVKRGDSSSHSTDDINVGQHIIAIGTLKPLLGLFDASIAGQGLVRLVESDVEGAAAGAVSSGVLTVAAFHIGRLPVAAFDFHVGGTLLCDPTAMKIGTGALSLPNVGAGSAIVALGFFAPVTATDPTPDFDANAVVDRTNAASILGVRWGTPTSTPFAAESAAGATVDISAASGAKVDVGLVAPTDLLGGSNPQIVPATAGGLFAVGEPGLGVTLHHDFAAWLADIHRRITRAGHPVSMADLEATGRWDGTTRTLTAVKAAAFLK